METQTEIAQKTHRRVVRYFWILLIGATTVSLIGNVAHAVLPFIPHVAVQIGAAAVPPIVLLAAVHGIALAVRAGASGRIYHCAVSAVAVIGVGAFALSFLALRDLRQTIGHSPQTAWIFPAIIDTAVAVSTTMLVALGDKPARRARSSTSVVNATTPTMQPSPQNAKPKVTPFALAQKMQSPRARTSVPTRPDSVQAVQAARDDATRCKPCIGVDQDRRDDAAHRNGDRRAHCTPERPHGQRCREGNYRTAQRIVHAAERRQQRFLAAAS